MLDWFRTVLLQDAVELRRFYPESPLWSHAPFNTPEFRTFELHLETTSNMNDLPMELRFKQLMPEVANQIQGMKEIMFNEFSGLTTNQQRLEEVVNHIDNQTFLPSSKTSSPNQEQQGHQGLSHSRWSHHKYGEDLRRGQPRLENALRGEVHVDGTESMCDFGC